MSEQDLDQKTASQVEPESRQNATLEALRDAELRYRTVADFTYDWEYWEGPDGTLRYVSPSCQRITGYPAGQFVKNPNLLDELIVPEDREKWAEHRRDALSRQPQELQFRIRRQDGEIRWIEHACQMVTDERGSFLGCRASNRDITQRVQAQEELREYRQHLEELVDERTAALAQANAALRQEIAERKHVEGELGKLSRAVEHSPSMVVVTNTQGDIEYVNPKFTQTTGYTAAQVLGKNPRIQKSDEHPAEFYKKMWDTITAGGEWRGDLVNRKKNGELYWEHASISPVRNAEGVTTHFVKVAEEITERVQAEAARSSLAAIVESSDDAVIGKTLDGTIVSWNAGAERIYGYREKEVVGQSISILLPPDRPDEVTHILERLKRGDRVAHFETRRVRKDGGQIHVSLNISPIRDKAGRAIGASAIARDITERKRADEALRTSQQFLQSALDALSANIAILDEAGTIIAVNGSWRAFGEENGLAWADYGIGRNYLAVLQSASGDSLAGAQQVATGIRELMAGQRDQFIMEYPCHSPSEKRWFVMRATHFYAGEGVRVVTSHENITNRKLTEQELHKATEVAETARRKEEERRREAERRRQIAESLGDILVALNSSQPLEEILDLIAVRARQLLNTRAVGIYSLEAEAGTFAIQAAQGLLIAYVAGTNIPIGQGVLKQAMVSRRPVAVPDVSLALANGSDLVLDAQTRARAGYWADVYQALLAVPTAVRDTVYGGILLYYTEPRSFSQDDLELAGLFGDQVALAIENARLRAEAERAAATAERSRLARDLHDAVTQTLFSASLIAEALPRLWEHHPEEGQRGLEELRQLTRGALAEMRTMLLELRPAALTEKPLGELLRHLTEAVTSRTRVPICLTVEGNSSLPPNLQIALYRIAQEGLNNMAKHASAQHATVTLHCTPWQVVLGIRDDGRGFDPKDILPDQLGLGIMRERADGVEAAFEATSQPGQGTKIVVTWPDTRGK